jgi:predicted transcriptional regulator
MTLRLPADLHEALKRLAEQDDRSLHSLIVHALRQLVNERATERPADR